MDPIIIIVLLVVLAIAAVVLFSPAPVATPVITTLSTTTTTTPISSTTTTTTPISSTTTTTTPAPNCKANGIWDETKPGYTFTKSCMLGSSYTGNMTRLCSAQGEWQNVVNNCVSSGNSDKIDITGKWKYIMSGNDWGLVDVEFNMNTGIGIMSNGNIPKNIAPGQTTITYKDGLGYQVNYPYNQFAKFTDSTYKKLAGGNFSFEKP